jgi:hypothetical protein
MLLLLFIGSNRGISMVYANTLCGTSFCLGSVLSSSGIIGSSYIMVLALKCGMMCMLGKGPSWKLELWYQCLSGATKMVIFRVIFGCKTCPMKSLLCLNLHMWVGISNFVPFFGECCS